MVPGIHPRDPYKDPTMLHGHRELSGKGREKDYQKLGFFISSGSEGTRIGKNDVIKVRFRQISEGKQWKIGSFATFSMFFVV